VNEKVLKAVEQIRTCFRDRTVVVRDDSEGGAYVIVEDAALGDPYAQETTWIGARITSQYPYADVYPVYVRGDLARLDGKALGDGTSPNVAFEGRTSVQVSRRSNHLNPARDTAAMKLQKVLVWLKERR
jgi:hypothetical protein